MNLRALVVKPKTALYKQNRSLQIFWYFSKTLIIFINKESTGLPKQTFVIVRDFV